MEQRLSRKAGYRTLLKAAALLAGLLAAFLAILAASGCRAPEDVILCGAAVSADASHQVGQIQAAHPDANTMPPLAAANLRAFARICGLQETVNAYLQHRPVDPNKAVCP